MYISPKKYLRFYDSALKVDHTFHRARKDLWELFIESFSSYHQPGYIPLIPSRFNAIKGYLCSRNEMLNSEDKRLAFEVAIVQIYESVTEKVTLSFVPTQKPRLLITGRSSPPMPRAVPPRAAPRAARPPPEVVEEEVEDMEQDVEEEELDQVEEEEEIPLEH